jgi:Patatin-like phospholipase
VNWALLGRALRLGFLLRVPLLTLVLLAGFGPLSQDNSLLENLFDQGNHPLNVAMVSFAAFLLAFTAIATLNLILHYGSDRLDDQRTVQMSQRRPLLTFALGTATAVIFVASVVMRTETSALVTIWWTVVGAVCAFLLVIVAKVTQLALTDPATTPHPPPFLIFPARMVPWAERKLDKIYCWSSPRSHFFKAAFRSLSQWPLRILRDAGQGYLVDMHPPPGVPLQLRSGHVFVLTLSLIAFGFYLVIGLTKRHITADAAGVPALAYLLLFCIVACWFLSALSFFFDRYRFPLFTAVAVLAIVTAQVPKSDHFFRVETAGISKLELLTPAEYMRGRLGNQQSARLIFVAAPGGGIQAAAWTAKVLEELSERPNGEKFRKAVGLISSVSGGSLGAMIYAASFTGQISPKDVITKSKQSAIDEVGWGWTFADFWRAAAPWFGDRTVDRGWALEEKWAAVNNLSKGEEVTLLSDWNPQATDMPALIFNSMLVETGEHVIFSNTDFPNEKDSRGIKNFRRLYPEVPQPYDIRVTTAARLSASFPYVAPASRPNLDSMYTGDYHFVDGGYYDNNGIDSIVGWLGEALEGSDEISKKVKEVLILSIQHFDTAGPRTKIVRGWSFQLYAPVSGLLSMWNAAPAQRDANEFRLFADRMSKNSGRKIWIVNIAYQGNPKYQGKRGYPGRINCKKAPLSWKLSGLQQECIDEAWETIDSKELNCIDSYLAGEDDVNCQYPAKSLKP